MIESLKKIREEIIEEVYKPFVDQKYLSKRGRDLFIDRKLQQSFDIGWNMCLENKKVK